MAELMPKSAKLLCDNDCFTAFYDTVRPVTHGHVVVVPKTPVSFVDLTKEQRVSLLDLVDRVISILKKKHRATGFNVGTDIGASAGQVVSGFSLHIIPRYDDGHSMRGGMRSVVPERPNLALASWREDWDR